MTSYSVAFVVGFKNRQPASENAVSHSLDCSFRAFLSFLYQGALISTHVPIGAFRWT